MQCGSDQSCFSTAGSSFGSGDMIKLVLPTVLWQHSVGWSRSISMSVCLNLINNKLSLMGCFMLGLSQSWQFIQKLQALLLESFQECLSNFLTIRQGQLGCKDMGFEYPKGMNEIMKVTHIFPQKSSCTLHDLMKCPPMELLMLPHRIRLRPPQRCSII